MTSKLICTLFCTIMLGCSAIRNHPTHLMCSYVVKNLGKCVDPRNALQGTEDENRFIQSILTLQSECGSACNSEIQHMYKTTVGIEYKMRSRCSYMRYKARSKYGSICDEWIGFK